MNKSSNAVVITSIVIALLCASCTSQKVYARQVDLDNFCPKFPLNSLCQGYKPSSHVEEGAAAVGQNPQIIKLKLKTSGSDTEWILIEKSENTVKLLYTIQSKRRRGFLNFLSEIAGIPIPLPKLGSRRQNDYPITSVVFEPDSCSLAQRLKQPENLAPQISQTSNISSCTVTGTNTVNLPEGTDIRSGRFTIKYQEGDLTKSITFRLPAEDE